MDTVGGITSNHVNVIWSQFPVPNSLSFQSSVLNLAGKVTWVAESLLTATNGPQPKCCASQSISSSFGRIISVSLSVPWGPNAL